MLVNFSKLKNNINHADSEITKNILEDLTHLYIKTLIEKKSKIKKKTKVFSLARSKMEAPNTYKARSLKIGIKKSCDTPASS